MSKIPEKHIALRDRLIGTVLDVGSAIMSTLPESWDVITKKQGVPNAPRARWQHLAVSGDSLQQQWVQHNGIESAGRTPRNYKMAQIILADRAKVEDLARRYGYGEHAVTYQLGTTVMMGTHSEHAVLGLEHDDAEDYAVALGIGQGLLVAGVGVRAAAYLRGDGAPRGYHGLGNGLRQGPVMPATELPPHIPML